mgnify:CR=1 FL=1
MVERCAAWPCQVPAGAGYRTPGRLHVEGDASAASYFLAAGVIGGGPVRVRGIGRESIQGDVAFAEVLARQGAGVRFGDNWIEARLGTPLPGGTIDCMMIPDAAMTPASVAPLAPAPPPRVPHRAPPRHEPARRAGVRDAGGHGLPRHADHRRGRSRGGRAGDDSGQPMLPGGGTVTGG